MLFLAVLSVTTIWYKSGYNNYITWSIWFIFVADFCYRLLKSESKISFIKKNPLLLIAIIPLDAIFQFARVAQIVRLFRLKVITKHFTQPMLQKLKNKKLTFIIPISFIMFFLTIVPMYYLEPSIESFNDAFMKSLGSLIFFGFSNFKPETGIGTLIVILLTIFGVMVHGLLISFLYTFIVDTSIFKRFSNKANRN